MLFHEMYGSYFAAASRILALAVEGRLDAAKMQQIIQEEAFGESIMRLPQALGQNWCLLKEGFETPLNHAPRLPISLLEKRWLKALLLDLRIQLFDLPQTGLEDIKPLYMPDMLHCYDQYADGDPYGDAVYIQHFRLILLAIREQGWLRLRHRSSRGRRSSWTCYPLKLEYSPRDDKFRLKAHTSHGLKTFNLARITSLELLETQAPPSPQPAKKKASLTLHILDERNALERAMMHFSHLEKESQRLDEKRYQMKLNYDKEDEAEMLIRVLAFGPLMQVVAPEAFIGMIKERLARQSPLFEKGLNLP